MAVEVWGQLPKSQDDPQTIAEAIAEAIGNHEADDEAHLGVGESLEVHRANDILDHPQGSVVSDKRQFTQLELSSCFESIDGWSVTAATTFHELGNFYLGTNTTTNNEAYAYLEDGLPVLCQDFAKNVLWQVVFEISGGAVGTYNLHLSLLGEIDSYLGLGFRIIGTTLYGLLHDGDDLHSVSLGSVSKNTTYVARAFANQESGNVEFWLNGTLLGQVAFEQNYTSDEVLQPYFSAKKTSGTGSVAVIIKQLLVSRDF